MGSVMHHDDPYHHQSQQQQDRRCTIEELSILSLSLSSSSTTKSSSSSSSSSYEELKVAEEDEIVNALNANHIIENKVEVEEVEECQLDQQHQQQPIQHLQAPPRPCQQQQQLKSTEQTDNIRSTILVEAHHDYDVDSDNRENQSIVIYIGDVIEYDENDEPYDSEDQCQHKINEDEEEENEGLYQKCKSAVDAAVATDYDDEDFTFDLPETEHELDSEGSQGDNDQNEELEQEDDEELLRQTIEELERHVEKKAVEENEKRQTM
jgi:hypothetical protein